MINELGAFVPEKYNDIQVCAFCRKQYHRIREEQPPGNQNIDYDVCPYCMVVNRVSAKWAFHNTRMG